MQANPMMTGDPRQHMAELESLVGPTRGFVRGIDG